MSNQTPPLHAGEYVTRQISGHLARRQSSNAYYQNPRPQAELHFPVLDINSYYNFLSTTMIVLFIVGLVIVFVYEYEALRRSKT